MVIDQDDWTRRLFHSIDSQDIDAFLGFMSDDVEFRFGNSDTVKSKSVVREIVSGYFSSINGLQHILEATWNEKNTIICHGNVTYTRHDASRLSVPFANIFYMHDDLIEKYLIFVDTSELYRAA